MLLRLWALFIKIKMGFAESKREGKDTAETKSENSAAKPRVSFVLG